MDGSSTPDRVGGYADRHPEQVFIGKAVLTILAVIALRDVVLGWLPPLPLLILLSPLAFLIYVRLKASAEDEHPDRMLASLVTVVPIMYAEGESRFRGVTWATCGLIVVNLAVFYGFQAHASPELVTRHLVFLPTEPTVWNLPLSAVTAMFLHGDTAHLWGNMLFLWAVGSVVERRIGWKPFLAAYLGTGIAAGLVATVVPWLFTGVAQHGLGASGAISGIMGVFAVRCYFKTMVFPIPLLGIFSLVIPLNVKLHVDSLVVIGLFFLADLSGAIAQVSGSGFSLVGHWAHLGGMVSGLGLAMGLSLGAAAAQERHLDIGESALDAGVGLKAGRESLQRVLEKEPDNPEALLALARLESRYHPSDEGRLAYERCIEVLGPVDPSRAAEVLRECWATYRIGVEPELAYRLSAQLFRMGDLELASRSLEGLTESDATPPEIAQKALFQLGRIYELMDLGEAARDAYRRYADTYPDSQVAAKARARAAGLE